MKFKIFPEIANAISFVNANRPLLFRTGVIYFVCLVAADLLEIFAQSGGALGLVSTIFISLLLLLPLLFFFINWTRARLGYNNKYLLSYLWPRDKDALKVVGFYIVFIVAYLAAILIAAGVSFLLYTAAQAFGLPQVLSIIFVTIIFLYASILSMGVITRYWFVAIGRSVGDHMTLHEAWRRTKGTTNKFGLLCVLVLLTSTLIYAPSYLSYNSLESFVESDTQQMIKTTIYSLPSFFLEVLTNAVWACVLARLYLVMKES